MENDQVWNHSYFETSSSLEAEEIQVSVQAEKISSCLQISEN